MAIDRRNGTEVAVETVKLAKEFVLSSDGLVVGIDLSGDPTVSQPVWGLWNKKEKCSFALNHLSLNNTRY